MNILIIAINAFLLVIWFTLIPMDKATPTPIITEMLYPLFFYVNLLFFILCLVKKKTGDALAYGMNLLIFFICVFWVQSWHLLNDPLEDIFVFVINGVIGSLLVFGPLALIIFIFLGIGIFFEWRRICNS